MESVRISLSPENYLKFQILMKKPVFDFNNDFSEFLTHYEQLIFYCKKNVKAFENMPLQVKDSDQCKWRLSL
jgi:hypothetical protein